MPANSLSAKASTSRIGFHSSTNKPFEKTFKTVKQIQTIKECDRLIN